MNHKNAKGQKATGADLTMVFGFIEKDGTITSGSGDFTVTKDSKDGIYAINFNKSFSAKPAVLATAAVNESDPTDLNKGQIATANENSASGVQIVIFNSSGDRHNRRFSFLATGYST